MIRSFEEYWSNPYLLELHVDGLVHPCVVRSSKHQHLSLTCGDMFSFCGVEYQVVRLEHGSDIPTCYGKVFARELVRRIDVGVHQSLLEFEFSTSVISCLRAAGLSVICPFEPTENQRNHFPCKVILASGYLFRFDDHYLIMNECSRFQSVLARLWIVRGKASLQIFDAYRGSTTPLRLPEPTVNSMRMTDEVVSAICVLLSKPIQLGIPEGFSLVESYAYHEELLARLAADIELVHSLTPREFEYLVARMLERDGFQVHLTGATRDGGIDLFARKREPAGDIVFGYELKKHRFDRPIGVDIIRSFNSSLELANVGTGVLVATSRFTADAIAVAQRLLIFPQDRQALHDWILDLRTK